MMAERFPTAAEVAAEMQWGVRLQELATAGRLVDESEFRSRLQWTARALEAAIAANRVFTLEHEGHRYFPAQFIDATTYLPKAATGGGHPHARDALGGRQVAVLHRPQGLAGRTHPAGGPVRRQVRSCQKGRGRCSDSVGTDRFAGGEPWRVRQLIPPDAFVVQPARLR